MKLNLRFFSFSLVTVLLLFPAMAQAGRSDSNSASEYRDLKKQEKQFIKQIENSKKRQNELRYVSGHMHNFRKCLLSSNIASVQRNCKGIAKKLKDQRLKNLLRTFTLSVNGKASVTKLEREAYLALCNHLESGLGATKTAMVGLQKVKIALLPYIPPKVVRQMKRHAKTLVRSSSGESQLLKKIKNLEVLCDKEKLRCADSPLRDKEELRSITGQLAVNRKKLKLIGAARTFAECLNNSVLDGKLLTEEKQILTKTQSDYTRIQASLGILKNS